jgi:hypothetical protein
VLAGLGAFMAALDVVVVSTALPTLQHRLEVRLADLERTINACNLVLGERYRFSVVLLLRRETAMRCSNSRCPAPTRRA